ncbi:similar to Saccharomyces cerevisiae YIR017C MET28 Basic leucine zipper (bZIP) transcriptional activator in the Cbf1p-Met4p-Met28p complex, participates in the regulation of sulfur metabolism [Maudiozyma barnettii]|uniref:Similar to Saccharomyces cerevisiae YIR017C MET28 Basic leucine zipper (BZIP) transcriptional activator in the Cbf1p-Met4p-Met28p complex, participates in the regulation of sulfur metabolism n=1 Tax=Maudiozyma barnettii TaxID=61262 RepID=A0A8H2VGL8_9SACH|nr:Met28p [Kazachstania barnettii]CAB4255289.1 similar to Saccharomyces cerevisiae YIR017C MET28 Basic leucine zipper (bZIP) transcriptional activator in the Cbf1p-Met4p-Met28p complex, participates in the regulation of sulfur metabolism [Kazachstania barnettii]CAD1783696.1 similar to Saccharomyces cerevisiae YIR017C MET28 Basic leucine zipper (bZIP) transcriptional activator in the Cbf1p-Met4p-Met28p complex, participates in the regulation of sulfur metabolism [Kazachstania barnettii]
MSSEVSAVLQNLISNDSKLGSRLLSLLLVNSGNGQEIIKAINKGDDDSLNKLDLSILKNLDTTNILQTVSTTLNESTTTATTTTNNNISTIVPDENENENENEEELQILKRKRNTEASARFRKRRRQRELDKLDKLKSLQLQISQFNDKINSLIDENHYWKLKLKKINERKSTELLNQIKRRNMQK